MHITPTGTDGASKLDLQLDGPFLETHFLYNPAQMARPVGGDPGDYYDREKQQYEAPSNHDGFTGGDAHVMNLDERKVLDNYIYNVKIECADETGFKAPYKTSEDTA